MKILTLLCTLFCFAGYAQSCCDLTEKKCIPCHGGIPPLEGEELMAYYDLLGNNWCLIEEHHLKKIYPFCDFAQALAFTNKVGALAEEEGHHPDILLSYGSVTIQLYTHKIDGLSESDFILAAKCDQLLEEAP